MQFLTEIYGTSFKISWFYYYFV